MKNFLKQIFTFTGITILSLAFVGYFINYRTTGDPSFVTEETIVYSDADLLQSTYTLHAGECFTALTNFADNSSVKIRFDNIETGKEEIGFIDFFDSHQYLFPLLSSSTSKVSKPTIVISLSGAITLEDFLKELIGAIEEYEVVGVYLEDSDYSEERYNIAQITSFCDQQKIPYGFVSDFSETSVKKYFDNLSTDDTYYPSYELLPHVFNLSSVRDGYKFDDSLSSCIFQTASIRNDNIKRYWITSLSNNHTLSEKGVMLISLKGDFGIEYASVSTEFESDLLEAYNFVESNL